MLPLIKQVEAESQYLLLEPYERKTTIFSIAKQISIFTDEKNSIMLVVGESEQLTGYCLVKGRQVNRNKHRVYLVIRILGAYCGLGIGTAFFHSIDYWTQKQGLHRLVLTAVTDNEAALGLHKKAGFTVEGIKKRSLRIGQVFKDEYCMAKLL